MMAPGLQRRAPAKDGGDLHQRRAPAKDRKDRGDLRLAVAVEWSLKNSRLTSKIGVILFQSDNSDQTL